MASVIAARSSSGIRSSALSSAAIPSLGLHVGGGQRVGVVAEHAREVGAHGVAEDDRVRHLHHRRLEVHGEQDALLLGLGDLLGQERLQRGRGA